MSLMIDSIRKTVVYSGHVQGVGFRRSVARLAEAYEVRGWVKNLSDGRVQMVAEAVPSRLDRFLVDVDDVLDSHIDHADVSESTATSEFSRFTIKL